MAKIDKVLGSISPLYGAVSGQGLFSGLRNLSPALLAVDAIKGKKGKKPGMVAEAAEVETGAGMKRGGKVKKYAKGGSASKRADGCATKGKTKGRFV